MKTKYVYKKKQYIILFKVIDFLGRFFFNFFKKKIDLQQTNKILVVRWDHIGDIVCSIPIYSELKKNIPQCQISVLTSPEGKEILQGNPFIDEIFSFPCPWFSHKNKWSLSNLFLAANKIIKKKFDCALELRGDIRNILFLKFCGVKRIVSYGITGGAFLLSIEVPWNKTLPIVERNLALLKSLGLNYTTDLPRIYWREDEKEALQIKNLLKNENKSIVAYHLGAGTAAKKWPEENFWNLIDKVEKIFNVRSILIGTQPVTLHNKNVLSFIGKTTIRQLIHLLRFCQLLVTNDSGPAHIAAAVGTPVVIIWSGTVDPKIWAPRGENVKIVRKDVNCQFCERKKCASLECLKKISIEDVFIVVKGILDENRN